MIPRVYEVLNPKYCDIDWAPLCGRANLILIELKEKSNYTWIN